MLNSVSVVSRPETALVGMFVRTNMQQAMTDCPKVWHEDFGPRMSELCGESCTESYGVSWMVDEVDCSFDYWAAVPVKEGVQIPEGMSTTTLPAGLYAELAMPSLEKLQEAYTTIWEKWLPNQKEYPPDEAAPSYEVYPADYMQTGKLVLYFPVKIISR